MVVAARFDRNDPGCFFKESENPYNISPAAVRHLEHYNKRKAFNEVHIGLAKSFQTRDVSDVKQEEWELKSDDAKFFSFLLIELPQEKVLDGTEVCRDGNSRNDLDGEITNKLPTISYAIAPSRKHFCEACNKFLSAVYSYRQAISRAIFLVS